MRGVGRRAVAVLVATALVLSGPAFVVETAYATDVQPANETGEGKAYPGQTVPVVNVSVGSGDEIVFSASPEIGTGLSQFGDLHSYGYIIDSTSTQQYEEGDDIVEIYGASGLNGTESIEVHEFNSSIVFVDDGTENSRYDALDDIYHVSVISGDPYISESGVKYASFTQDEKYLTANSIGQYQPDFPIIHDSDGKIASTDEVLREGNSAILDAIPSNVEHYEDQDGVSGYDANEPQREPIYLSGGDGVVSEGEDVRLTQVGVFSGYDDGNISTINLNQQKYSKVRTGDSEVGVSLRKYTYTPTVNIIIPENVENSSEGEFETSDQIIIDTNRDGIYDAENDIPLQGDPVDGTPYTTSNIDGIWKKGYNQYGDPIVIFDKGNDQDSNNDDLIIYSESLEIGSADTYSDIRAPLEYWDSDDNAKFNIDYDSVYFDVADNSEDTNGLNDNDFRLTNFVAVYEEGTLVSPSDIDSSVAISQFNDQERYLDDDHDNSLDIDESIISSDDRNLGKDDSVIYGGSVADSLNQFSTEGDIELHYGDKGFLGYEPIISISNKYPVTSDDYNTNKISPGESLRILAFSSDGREIERYISSNSQFEDGDQAARIHWFDETSGNQIDVQASDPIHIRQFSPNIRFVNSEEGYIDNGSVVKENDGSSETSIFGDRLTALTLTTQGTLTPDAIESVSLHQDGTEIASTSTSYDGVWTLEPSSGDGLVGIGPSATNLTVSATLAADAPAGASVDFAVSPVDDGGLAAEFDAGDRGMFFADGPPIGGIDAGKSYTVASASDITAGGTAFHDPTREGETAIELAFTDDIDPSTTEPEDFAVATTDGGSANVTEVGDDDGDARIVLEIEAGVSPLVVDAVTIPDGAVAVQSGAAVPGQTLAVERTSVTVTEAAERDRIAYQGERVAILANDAGAEGENTTPNVDERIRVDSDVTGDGRVDELHRIGTTGDASLLAVLDTGESNASAYRATFESEDGAAGETVSVPVRNLSLSVAANRTNTTDVAGPIAATVTASAPHRVIEAELLEAANGTVLDTRQVVLDGEGSGVVRFPARIANVTIAVTDLGTGVGNRTANVSVRKGYPGATFPREFYAEERGDVARIDVRLVDTENATVSVGGPSVNYHEEVTVVDRDGDGAATVRVNTHRAGSGIAGTGVGVAGNENDSRPDDGVASVRRMAPVAKGLTDPLEPGNYTLEARVGGELTDVATLAVDDRSTSGASTLVAPAGVSLETPADFERWTTERDAVAVGDQAIVAVDASGLEGFLDDGVDLRRGSPAAASTGAFVNLQRSNPPPNRPARRLNVSNAGSVVDGRGNALYLVVPSKGGPFAIESGESFDATFVLNETSPYVGGAGRPNEERESAETAIDFESPTGRFTDSSENGTVDLPPTASATVAGETNVAPGTNVTITVRSDDENDTFATADTTTVSDDGTFDGSVDLEDAEEGTEYTVVATANDDELATSTGRIVEEEFEGQAALTTVAVAGGGGGSTGDDRPSTTDEPNRPTTTEEERTTESSDSVGERAVTFVTRDVPEFIRTQETNIVVGLGVLSFLYGLVGLRRLTR